MVVSVMPLDSIFSLVEIELDWLYDWILALAIFMSHSHKVYNNKKVVQNIGI